MKKKLKYITPVAELVSVCGEVNLLDNQNFASARMHDKDGNPNEHWDVHHVGDDGSSVHDAKPYNPWTTWDDEGNN